MTSNHTQSKQFSSTASVCRDVACNVSKLCRFDYGDVARYVSTCDSPRFATLPQYTEPTEPYTYYLSTPFLSQPVAKLEFGMRGPKGYLIVVLAAKECGLPQTESRGIAYKYLHFLINSPIH